ncbi:hypothetical protein QFZ66_000445 [Streptomyces sp. B4I13]|nr:hypothetical protein [Streptomyces sp. B4I13]
MHRTRGYAPSPRPSRFHIVRYPTCPAHTDTGPEAIWNPETNDYVLYWSTNATVNGIFKYRIHSARTKDFRSITTPQIRIDPPRQHAGRRRPDDRGARRYRPLPLSAGRRRQPEQCRGRQLDPGDVDQPRQPLQHRPRGKRGPKVVISSINSASSATDKADATWIVRAGLANTSCLSFESADKPGQFLRHFNYQLNLNFDSGSSAFAQDATFCPTAGNSGVGTSFQSVNFPTKYIRHYNYTAYIAANGGTNTPAFRVIQRHRVTNLSSDLRGHG